MIAAIDIETQGLDATKYIIGTLITEQKTKPYTTKSKQRLWQTIQQITKSQYNRNKTLQIYAHNHAYDFYGYADLTNKDIKYYSQRPFIATLKHNNKEVTKFLDTYAIYKMPLEELGELIGLPKLAPPKEMKEGTITEKQIPQLTEYNIRDTQIVLKSIQYLQEKLKQENIKLKRLMTINQIAIQYIITKLQRQPTEQTQHLFYNQKKGQFHRTLRNTEIHEAYRGGHVRIWQTGTIKNVTIKDKNSLYGYCLSKMQIPDLRTERKIWQPQTTTPQTTEQIINKTGITRCIIKNEKNKLGILPIRTPTGNHYPTNNKYLIGTWTNKELQQATQNGYKIIKIEWTIQYENGPNPFTPIMQETYQKRTQNEDNKFNYWFYKQMQNNGIGKMAQYKKEQEMFIDTVEKAQQYIQEKCQIIKGISFNYLYRKEHNNYTPKRYYCPIIPTLVNAEARIIMNNEYTKIQPEDLIYTDTDSIHYKGNYDNIFENTREFGQFKTEHENKTAIYYGKKSYMIDNQIKVSGMNKTQITPQQFNNGIIQSQQMNTLQTTKEITEIGKFTTITRNLRQQQQTTKQIQELYDQNIINIDDNIKDIEFYIPTIQKI